MGTSRASPKLPTETRTWTLRLWDGANSQPVIVAIIAVILTAIVTIAANRWFPSNTLPPTHSAPATSWSPPASSLPLQQSKPQ